MTDPTVGVVIDGICYPPIEFGKHVDYCYICHSVLSSDGCTNTSCINARFVPILQQAYTLTHAFGGKSEQST